MRMEMNRFRKRFSCGKPSDFIGKDNDFTSEMRYCNTRPMRSVQCNNPGLHWGSTGLTLGLITG
jgi:hypothetical protein